MEKEPVPVVPRGINFEIEYLRAIAVLMVVLVHSEVVFPPTGFGQWTGVDTFFSAFPATSSAGHSCPTLTTTSPLADGGPPPRHSGCAVFFGSFHRRGFGWPSPYSVPELNRSGVFKDLYDSLESAAYVLLGVHNLAFAHGSVRAHEIYWSLALEDRSI